jgi:hypothetical protein
MTPTLRQRARDSSGQSLIEFAIILPFLVLLSFGAAEIGFLAARPARGHEADARGIEPHLPQHHAAGWHDRDDGDERSAGRLFVALETHLLRDQEGRHDRHRQLRSIFLYQRFEYGAIGGASHITTRGSGAFGGAPNYEAVNSDNNSGLQVTNLPANLIAPRGGMIYVMEIYTMHQLLTPVANFGLRIPTTLYSIAYF